MAVTNIDMIFQILEALGSLATVGAFIFLFRRDKDKQSQIDKLTGIATVLNAQNETMKLQNDLIAQQVDIFRNTSLLKDNDERALEQLRQIEEKKLRLSVKPNLWLNGAGYNGTSGELKIDLNNKGEDAELLDYKLISNDIILQFNSFPYILEKGQHRYILGRTNGEKHIQHCEYEIEVIYQDKLKNLYSIRIKGNGANVKIIEYKESE